MNQISYITSAIYLASAGAQWLQFAGKVNLLKSRLLIIGLIAISLHCYLLYQWIETGTGQNLNIANMFSFISWIIASIIVLVSWFKEIENLMSITSPIAAVSIIFVVLFPHEAQYYTHNNLAGLSHIFISIAAVSVLSVATCQAIFILITTKLLKKNNLGSWLKLIPPLEDSEKLLFQIIWFGFLLLSLGLITTYLYVQQNVSNQITFKLSLTIAAWLLYATLLYGKIRSGWSGSSAAILTIIGTILLVGAYFGSKIL